MGSKTLYYLKQLEKAGLVKSTKDGKGYSWYLTEEAQQLLKEDGVEKNE